MYEPAKEILEKYARVLINCALNDGEGVKKDEVVVIEVPECARPFLVPLRNTVIKAGAHPILRYYPDEISKEFFELASQEQLSFFPDKFYRGLVDQMDHLVHIIADTNKHELEGVDPKKIMTRNVAFKPYKDWRIEKETQGKFTWNLALYGTQHMADEAKMSIKKYWAEIIKACYLDELDPVAKWKEILAQVEETRSKLSNMDIEHLHIVSENTDLIVGIGPKRKWLGGSGRNIPSFEVFISPDWRVTQGHIQFTEPLYRYGNLIENVYLEFDKGVVINAQATKGEHVLKEMIAVENADKIGEFSLTDGRLSRITKFMGETLFDENVGGKFGNMHLALGTSFRDSYTGDKTDLSSQDWQQMGYNDSVIHTDIVSTENRVVTAYGADGSERIIYKDGKFTI